MFTVVRNYHITTIWGIPIRVNVSLVVFLPVLMWLIGSGTQIELYAGLVEGPEGTRVVSRADFSSAMEIRRLVDTAEPF